MCQIHSKIGQMPYWKLQGESGVRKFLVEIAGSYVFSLRVKAMKKCIILLAVFCTLATCGAAEVIINNAQSDYTIYSGKEATAAEKTAAGELQKFLKSATGATLPVTDKYTGSKQILVGLLPEAAALLPKIGFNTLKPDEILICPAGNNLVLAGERPRGSLYAVYTFLENNFGIKFWTATEQTVPHLTKIELPETDFRYAPRIKIRSPYIYDLINNPAFAVQCKTYGPTKIIPEAWGGTIDLIGPWHTFDRFLPVEQYLKSNPEYFSMRDGKRVGGQYQGQLCLSNPKLREKFLSIVFETLRKNPDPKFISVTQNDNENYCQCDECRKIDEAGGGPAASIIRFVNFISENVEKEFPNVVVQTFAYQYSRHAPTDVKPRHNVSVFLCTMGTDFGKPLDDPSSKLNVAFMTDLDAWNKISTRIDIWDYITNFTNYLYPHPNLDAIKKNIKIFASRNPHLIMPQGDAMNPGNIGDLQPLKIWVLSKLLWNPELDGDTLEKEFISGYYGAAAPKVAEYLALRRDTINLWTKPVDCFMFTTPWLDDKTLLNGLKILDDAKSTVANTPELRKRVEILAKPFEYVLVTQYERLKGMPGCPSRSEVAQIAGKYVEFLEENKAVNLSEVDPLVTTKAFLKRMAENKNTVVKLPEFFSTLKKGSYIVLEEDAFSIFGGDEFGKVIEDPKAANGWTLEIYHHKYEWAIKLVCPEMGDDVEYDIYAAFRLYEPAKAGLVEFGGWDLPGKQLYMSKHVDADKITVENYSYVLLGSGKLRANSYLFFAPKVNPPIKRSLLDHVVLVKRQ